MAYDESSKHFELMFVDTGSLQSHHQVREGTTGLELGPSCLEHLGTCVMQKKNRIMKQESFGEVQEKFVPMK